MLAIKITTFITLLISLTRDVTYSAYGRDSVISDDDGRMLREILQRLNKIQKHIDRIEGNMDQMKTNNNIRFDKLEANTNDQNMQSLSIVMETIVEQQMVITAEIFTVSQTLPFCCCQYQNTTERPEIETTTSPRPLTSLPTNCADAMGARGSDGIYKINLTDSNIGPFDVYCTRNVVTCEKEKDISGIWLIIQRRQDLTNFYQKWTTYQLGFGKLTKSFWIGLDKLYALTKSTEQELWVRLENSEGLIGWAKYSHFSIGSESEKYTLKTLGNYVGTAGDSLSYHKGQNFSTYDYDNDKYLGSCAEYLQGAWWFKDCHWSSLNSMYQKNGTDGIYWHTFDRHEPIKYAHMAIRPKK